MGGKVRKNFKCRLIIRKMTLFLVLAIGVLFFGVSTKVQAAAVCKFGDINNDGKIDITDLLNVLRHIAVSTGQIPYEEHPDWLLEGVKYEAADVDQDGLVSQKDSELIQYHIVATSRPTIGKLILTVTLADSRNGKTYDRFPVIYDVKDPNGCYYPRLKSISEAGYSFGGWYTSPSGGRKVSSYSRVTTKNDHTLYALWTVNKYHLSYDANGGNCSAPKKEVAYRSSYGSLPIPVRNGYKFDGWYTAPEGGEKVTAQTKMGASPATIYAHWKKETEISLNKTNVTVYIGQTYTLRATVTGQGGRQRWSSSDPKIASVDPDGKVTAKRAGVARITVSVNGVKKVCTVTVKNISLKLNKTSLVMGVGQAVQLTATVNGPSQKITWSTSDKTVIQISSNGKITALKRGIATVRAKANGVMAAVKVTVDHLDIRDYLTKGAGGAETVTEMRKLAKAVGKMKAGNKKKYPDAYYVGNKMVIGVNNRPEYGRDYDEYIRIENNGNKQVLFYGAKIGYTKQQMEKKFKAYGIVSYDGGRSYSNANAWAVYPVFKNTRLVKYVYLSKPTSGEDPGEGPGVDPVEIVSYKKLREKGFVYKNDEFMYGIAFGTADKVYIGVWDRSGTSSSYEDFTFEVEDGVYGYTVKGGRSSYIYDIHLVPHQETVEVNISCRDTSYAYFNVDQVFQYTKDAFFVNYAQ